MLTLATWRHEQMNINVGLIGFGFAGRTFHAPVLSAVAGLGLTTIVQRSSTASGQNSATQLYPEARIVRSVDELLEDRDVRLVVIATPNPTHATIARQCLNAGRDVVVDKPFTTTSAEARELISIASAKSRLLTVFQNRRWDTDFLTAQQVVASGELGQVVSFESHYDRFRPQLRANAWRERDQPGSGVLFDLGSHLLDQALVLFGTPQWISADVRREREGAVVDDAFDVCLGYPKIRAWLRASMLAADSRLRFVVRGTRGTYTKYGLDPQEQELIKGAVPSSPDWGAEPEAAWGTLVHEEEDRRTSQPVPSVHGDYRRFYENVRDAMLGKAALQVTSQQAYNVIRAIELAQESSRRRCALPWSEERTS
jgi:scyllo-inositol 2-dehydrogenase (NADP+)